VAQRFRPTVFRAALDASAGCFWDVEPDGYRQPRRRTQIRWLDRAVAWLGLSPALCDDQRRQRGQALGVGTTALIQGAADLSVGPGESRRWRTCGQVVKDVLECLPGGDRVLEGLLKAGRLAGLWGRPFLVDPRHHRLRELVFRPPGSEPEALLM
jgi:hypothetical protein